VGLRLTLGITPLVAHPRTLESFRLHGSSRETYARSLRIAVLQEIARVVDFEAYAWLLTDPRTSVGTSPLAEVPWLPDLPRQIKLKYQTPVNRWTRLKRHPVALLHQATRGKLAASLVWRELLADLAPPLTAALRRTQALTFTAQPPGDESVPGPVVLLPLS